MRHTTRGFTLLELIVVIAIIGVLSVVILPTFSTAIDKAKFGKTINFASSLDRSLEIVGSWRFEEGSGTTVKDESGGGNNATIANGTWSTDTYGGTQQYSMSYNGTSTTIQPVSKASYEIGLGSKAWSVWFKTGYSASQGLIFRRSGAANVGGFIIQTVAGGQVQCWLNNTPSSIGIITLKSYTDNKWHHVTCSLDRPGSILKLYIDGELVGSTDSSLLAGVDLTCSFVAQLGATSYSGLADDFRIYNSSITLSQAKQIYLEGISSGRFANK